MGRKYTLISYFLQPEELPIFAGESKQVLERIDASTNRNSNNITLAVFSIIGGLL